MRQYSDFVEKLDRLSDLFSMHVESLQCEEILMQQELLELFVLQLNQQIFAMRRHQPIE